MKEFQNVVDSLKESHPSHTNIEGYIQWDYTTNNYQKDIKFPRKNNEFLITQISSSDVKLINQFLDQDKHFNLINLYIIKYHSSKSKLLTYSLRK